MFFYNEVTPQINDYVIVRIKEIKDFGCICELPEYNDALAYLNVNDITTEKIRKIHDLKRHLKLNAIEVLEIKEIDDLGNINLNRKYLDLDVVENKYNKYIIYEKIYNFISNNKQVTDSDSTNVLNELKNCKVDNIEIEDLFHKFPILLNLKLKQLQITEYDNQNFDFTEYTNVNSLKHNFMQIKSKYDFIKDFSIINLKSGKFNLKLNNKFNQDVFNNIINEIKSMNYNKNINVEVIIPNNLDNPQPLLNIGIIGHVSHGKTTLIQRLTNVDTKKYKKELETNKTLKLGYTNAYITKCFCNENIVYINNKCLNKNGNCISKFISIVDCPGHHILMNTMLCGTSIMDTAILMIAANEECPQPQTIDHLMAITINEKPNNFFENSLILLNKCDLIEKQDALKKHEQVRDFIKDSIVENCNIIPTSAQKNINLNHVSEWMFNYILEKEKIDQQDSDIYQSLIVRTFDINKPGTSINDISGLVIGCSILTGTFNVGDEIIILPECIKTKIYELYTDKTPLVSARKGGLIGVKTDLNTFFADSLIGSFFIKTKDYKEENLKPENSEYTFTYLLRKGISSKQVFKENEYIDLNIQGKFIQNCKIQKFNKSNKTIVVNIPTKTYIHLNIKISFMKNNTLIGYGQFTKQEDTIKPKLENNFNSNFSVNLDNLYQQLSIINKNNKKNIIKLPNPIITFQNTVSIFQNFIEISNIIESNHNFLGNYIMNELGLQNMSINENQLILKGRTDETRIETVLTKYLLEHKLCKNCLSYETFIDKIQNCKMLICKKCNYTIKK